MIIFLFIFLDSDAEPIITRNKNRKFGNPSQKVVVSSKALKNAGAGIISEKNNATDDYI